MFLFPIRVCIEDAFECVGVEEARNGGKLIKEAGLEFDAAYTSCLKRAIKTLFLTLEESDQLWIPVTKSWRLNERHYGALTGLNKQETVNKHGIEQVRVFPCVYADDCYLHVSLRRKRCFSSVKTIIE